MKIFFPIHLNGDNRGCEAIAKGTAMILKERKENLIGLCTDVELDHRLRLDEYVTLQPKRQKSLSFRIENKLYKYFVHNEWKKKEFTYQYEYASFLRQMQKGDIMLSTGGDMMCYDENEVIYTVNYLHSRGIDSILWGCSIGENNLTSRKLDALNQFTMIYARETLTQEVLENHNLKNVVVYPDPAFVLEPEVCQLPQCFKRGEVIGINLSNFVIKGSSSNDMFAMEVNELIHYILENTDKQILLIPHVMWKGQDDRIICQMITEKYKSDRISVLNSDMLNYGQIRFVISNCYCFIGARTHAVISAYATCTPAIALGYSIKSRGIAKDIGMPEEMVIDTINMKKGQLLNTFIYLTNNMTALRESLLANVNSYRKKAWDAINIIYNVGRRN